MTALLLCALVTGADPDIDKLKDQFAKLQESKRKGEETYLKGLIAEQDKKIADAKKLPKAKAADIIAVAKSKKELHEKQLKEQNLYSWGYTLQEMKEGDFGKVGANGNTNEPPTPPVFQVVDKNNVLIKWGNQIVWLEGVSGVVDGSELRLTDYVLCTGPKEYQSAVGKRTVMSFKIIK